MCGIIGIFSNQPVATEIYDGLIHLQHRGQDAVGICTYDQRFHIKRGPGYVRDVFHQGNMELLDGDWGIGHTRYATVGTRFNIEDAQPFRIYYPYGIAMARHSAYLAWSAHYGAGTTLYVCWVAPCSLLPFKEMDPLGVSNYQKTLANR